MLGFGRTSEDRSPLLPLRDPPSARVSTKSSWHSYTLVANAHDSHELHDDHDQRYLCTLTKKNVLFLKHTSSKLIRFHIPVCMIILVTLSIISYTRIVDSPWNTLIFAYSDSGDSDPEVSFVSSEVHRLWASYSPYYPVEKYTRPPKDCDITQVNILQRHGARYPTLGFSIYILQALSRLQAAEAYEDERLRFLLNYTYDLGISSLVPYGASQSFKSGHNSFERYSHLVSEHDIPFVRASDSDRVIHSALNWTAGFASGNHNIPRPPLAVVISEQQGSNDTLDDNRCPNANPSGKEIAEWIDIYASPIAHRLNAGTIGLPKKLTPQDAHSLIALCAFDTVSKEEYSPFCDLFTRRDFEGFEYAFDVEKFYRTGYGQELGPVQGVGYVNELLARLTDSPVRDHTQTNRTLDSNPETFPLGRGIYADFSHDNLIIAVFSAMGMFKDREKEFDLQYPTLDPTKIDKKRVWITSQMVPFSGRMVVERMDCGLPGSKLTDDQRLPDISGEGKRRRSRQRRRKEKGAEASVYVRILVNDAVQKVAFCEGIDDDGLCLLKNFVKSQEYARKDGDGDWERCFEKIPSN